MLTRAELTTTALLVIAQAKSRPGRVLLTTLAITAAACVVVWVVSGYDALHEKFDAFSAEYLGRYSLIVAPQELERKPGHPAPRTGPLAAALVDELRRDTRVMLVDPVVQVKVRVSSGNSSREENSAPRDRGARAPRPESPRLVGTDAGAPPYALLDGRWISPAKGAAEAAISSGTARQMSVKLGDEVQVRGGQGANATFTIVGIVEQPTQLPPTELHASMPSMRSTVLRHGPADSALYVAMNALQPFVDGDSESSYLGVILKPGAAVADFKRGWADRLAQSTPAAELQTMEVVDSKLRDSSTNQAALSQAYTATGISLLAALFIIATTLNMGVDERVRQFAMLRAIAFTRWQIGAAIVFESLLLGLFGWITGLIAGKAMLAIVQSVRPDALAAGAALGPLCIGLSGLCAVGGSLAASLIPAFRAMAVRPLDAAVGATHGANARSIARPMAVGIVLVAINPVLVYWIPMPDAARYGASAAIGCVSMAIGFVLLAPAMVMVVERLFGPLIARVLGLQPELLSSQLSTNLWRSAGVVSALTLGLGLFIAMQTWGYTMLAPFLPGRWMPELLISLPPQGVSDAEVETIRHLPGIRSDAFLPLAVEQPKFATDITGARQRTSISRQDNCLVVGVDCQRAFGGDRPLMDPRFVEGTRASAMQLLRDQRGCLIPDHFQRESGLGVGDRLTVIPPDALDRSVEYTIAGVVELPGWHLISKFGMRTRSGRSAAMIFAPIDEVRRDFGISRTRFLWTDIEATSTGEQIAASIGKALAASQQQTTGISERRGDRRGNRSQIRAQSRDELRNVTSQRAEDIFWTLSKLPLVTLTVTSLGVLNAVLASIRARRWDFGVLRAVGVTRAGLCAMILGETCLVGIAACVLSFSFGTLAGFCGAGVSRYVDVHGGAVTTLVIPWTQLAFGFGLTLMLCLIAAILPALRLGMTEPLKLLSSGRGSNSL